VLGREQSLHRFELARERLQAGADRAR
jgi:hypothetical protein